MCVRERESTSHNGLLKSSDPPGYIGKKKSHAMQRDEEYPR